MRKRSKAVIPIDEVIKAIADISGVSVDNIIGMKQLTDDSDDWATEEDEPETELQPEPEVMPETNSEEESQSADQSPSDVDEEEEVSEFESPRSDVDFDFEKTEADGFEWHEDDPADDPLGILNDGPADTENDLGKFVGERKEDEDLEDTRTSLREIGIEVESDMVSCRFELLGFCALCELARINHQ